MPVSPLPAVTLPQLRSARQLPFAVVPLVRFTGDPAKMGRFANPAWLKTAAWCISLTIIALNVTMLSSFLW